MNDWMRAVGGIRDVTPGKWVLKKDGTEPGCDSRREKCEEGRKRVHVKDPSCGLLVLFYLLIGGDTYGRGNGDEHEFLPGPDV